MKHVRPYCRWRLISTSCAIALVAAIAVVPWRVVAQEAPPEPGSTPLADAVKQFNVEAKASQVGKNQPPLTEDEVVAAIRWTLHDQPLADVTKDEYAALKKVAETKRLPKDARLEVQTGFRPGDELDYTIWSVRLQMPRGKPHLTYGFPIREHFVDVQRVDPYEVDSPPHRRRFDNSLTPTAQKVDESLPALADAIERFNAKADKSQPPLTENEVVAALYWTELNRRNKDVTDREYAAIEQIAKTRRLPKDADFEAVSHFQPGDGYEYEKWSVRLQMISRVNGGCGFIIRDQFLCAQPADPYKTDSPPPKVSGKVESDDLAAVATVATTALLQKPEATADQTKAKANTEFSKLLVGTWRGGYTDNDELVFRADGTFTQSIPDVMDERAKTANDGGSSLRSHRSGTWKVEGNKLIVSGAKEPQIRGLPGAPPPLPDFLNSNHVQIVRLDDSLLRMTPSIHLGIGGPRPADWAPPESPMLFYRRVAEVKPADYDPAIPANLRQIALSARLTAKEAMLFADWVTKNLNKEEQQQLEVVNRIIDARDGKVDFAGLFQLTPEEAKSYDELLQFAKTYHRALSLASSKQLTAVETSAVEKLSKLPSSYWALTSRLYAPVDEHYKKTKTGNYAPAGVGWGGPRGAQLPDDLAALDKVVNRINELNAWISETVLTSDQL